MSISSLANTQTYTENRRSAARQSKPSGLSFQDQLTQAAGTPTICLRMYHENTVYSGAIGETQCIYAEYTENSTPEDPVVRVSGTADNGSFDFTCHIKDIDPSNASYAELAALFGYLQKTGAYQSALGSSSPSVVPVGMHLECGDVTQKRDYLQEIRRYGARAADPKISAGATELLAAYQSYASGSGASRDAASVSRAAFTKNDLLAALSDLKSTMVDRMKLNKEKKEEAKDWERLMEYVDAWIESLREEGDIEKTARAYAALKAAEADAKAGRKDLGDFLLDQLSQHLAV